MQTSSDGNCRPLSSFHRRRSKLKQTFINSLCNFTGLSAKRLQFEKRARGSDGYNLQGLFLVLDHRGRKIYSQFIEVQFYVHGDGGVSFSTRLRPGNSTDRLQFVWTDRGRWKRIKSTPPPPNKRGDKKEVKKCDRLRKPGQRASLVLNWSKKGREGYRCEGDKFNSRANKRADVVTGECDNDSQNEQEDRGEEDDHCCFDKDTPRRRHIKTFKGSTINYLLGKRVVRRNSKKWRREIEDLKFSTSATGECRQLDDVIDMSDDLQARASRSPTLGDYFRFPLSRRHSNCARPVNANRKGGSASKSSGQTELSDFETKLLKTVSAGDYGKAGSAREGQAEAPESATDVSHTKFVWVRLSRAQARPDVLSSEFKLDYREAPCKPRRFVLNVSRLLYQHVVLQTRLRVKLLLKMDLSTYLVFTFSRAVDDEVDEYRLTINSSWSEMPIGRILEKLFAAKECTPTEEILRGVIHAIDSTHLRRLGQSRDTRGNEKRGAQPVCLFDMVTSAAQWETDSLCLPYTTEWCETFSSDLIESRSKREVNSEIIDILTKSSEEFRACNKVGPNNSNLCGICLSEINAGETTESQTFLLALTSCSHWFCEECWKSRVLIELSLGRRPFEVPCPEKDCPSKLDHVTLLSVLPVSEIRKINAIKIENYVMASRLLKMCPNPTCHRLLLKTPWGTSRRTPVIVTCECGSQVCFRCLSSPHWPAPCGGAEKYHKQLAVREDDVLHRLLSEREFPEVVRRGKKCPRCGLFILQSSSKKMYACSCGCQFCWPCGKRMTDNEDSHRMCVETFHQSDKVLKEIVNNSQPGSKRATDISRWYGTALVHRKMRHPEVVAALYSMAESIAENVSTFQQSGHYVGDVGLAAGGWGKRLKIWSRENYESLQTSQDFYSGDELRRFNEDKVTYSRASSASSASSMFNETGSSTSLIYQAAESIVQMKLELHYVIEYTAVFMDTATLAPAKLAQCLERAEDLCTATGLLLQNSQNCRQKTQRFWFSLS
ncbi:hypothetical protein Btru_056825 [Bulinus truncatus]|nr:hypothetical protein Btru_056825 [Bulinus truncatus]